MKSRLSRPLLAVVVSGAFLAGGGTFAAPALAEPPPTTTAPTSEPPAPTEPTTTPTTTPTTEPPVTGAPTSPPAEEPPTTPTDVPPTTPTTTPPTTPPTTAPPADKTAPSGTFTPNRWSIFPGQSVTLTLTGIADNVSKPAQIKRVINWGDGYAAAVSPTAKTVAHTYKSSGRKPITMTLTDAAGNKRVVTSKGPNVVPNSVKYKLSRTSVFHGQKFVWELLSVPAGATKIAVSWGDGRSTIITKPKKQKITRHYHMTPSKNPVLVPKGTKVLVATAYNKYGAATPQVVGKVTLKPDTAKPVLRLTLPSKKSKASSWKALKGTVTDTGSGIKEMYLAALVGKSNGSVVCYSSKKKKWIDSSNAAACLTSVKPSNGKFSAALKNTPKGYLIVMAIAGDWANNTNTNRYPFEGFIN